MIINQFGGGAPLGQIEGARAAEWALT